VPCKLQNVSGYIHAFRDFSSTDLAFEFMRRRLDAVRREAGALLPNALRDALHVEQRRALLRSVVILYIYDRVTTQHGYNSVNPLEG
jgi:hypothetical protein